MDEYLDNYINYISNFKKSVSIGVTETYISSHPFDLEMNINPDESHIKSESFIGLINSKKFYRGHSTREKIHLLIQCLEILHNYSKNLLVNFSVYSTKSIQEVTTNIQDFLVHLPYYSSYLSDSLGYEFDPTKREWFIKDKSLSRPHKLRLAAACLLWANIRLTLTEMQSNDDQRSSSSDNPEEFNSSIPETIEHSNNKWICEMCEALNASGNVNCMVCLTSRLQPEEPIRSEYTARSAKVRQTKDPCGWECKSCTFINIENNANCEVCGTVSHSVNPAPDWECEQCSFRNSLEMPSCLACNGPRSRTYQAQKINHSNTRPDEINVNNFTKYSNSPIKYRTNVGGINHLNTALVNGSHKRSMETREENRNTSPKKETNQLAHRSEEIHNANKRSEEINVIRRPDKSKKDEVNIAHNTPHVDYNRRSPKASTGVSPSKYRQDNRTPHTSIPDISKYAENGERTGKSQQHEIKTSTSPKSGITIPAKPTEGPKIGSKSQPIRNDPITPNTSKNPSPDRKDHRSPHQARISGDAGPTNCEKCNLDKKGRLVDEKGKRIENCKSCQRLNPKPKNWFFRNCCCCFSCGSGS